MSACCGRRVKERLEPVPCTGQDSSNRVLRGGTAACARTFAGMTAVLVADGMLCHADGCSGGKREEER